jgi:hypothetical protein
MSKRRQRDAGLVPVPISREERAAGLLLHLSKPDATGPQLRSAEDQRKCAVFFGYGLPLRASNGEANVAEPLDPSKFTVVGRGPWRHVVRVRSDGKPTRSGGLSKGRAAKH